MEYQKVLHDCQAPRPLWCDFPQAPAIVSPLYMRFLPLRGSPPAAAAIGAGRMERMSAFQGQSKQHWPRSMALTPSAIRSWNLLVCSKPFIHRSLRSGWPWLAPFMVVARSTPARAVAPVTLCRAAKSGPPACLHIT